MIFKPVVQIPHVTIDHSDDFPLPALQTSTIINETCILDTNPVPDKFPRPECNTKCIQYLLSSAPSNTYY